MAKVVQVLGNLNKNLFALFAFAVKKFRGSSLAKGRGEDFGAKGRPKKHAKH
jgi:hypothetical protein